jgi:predicted nuclease of predicted toxin-antitoxin system
LRFIVDVGVSPRVAAWLRGQGHDALHLVEHGMERAVDVDIAAMARADGRVVLTCDLDFAGIVAVRRVNVSLIIVRLMHPTADAVIRRLVAVLPLIGDDLRRGAIVVIEEGRHRVRLLPA